MTQPDGPPRSDWHGVKCASLDDMRTQNIRFWQQAGGAAIRKAAWELVVEMWQAQGRDPNELKFQRVAHTVSEAQPDRS
jgi:hypothetical protein